MANHFNDLLLQTLKQINVRLDRLDGCMDRLDSRIDHVIDTKADKADSDTLNGKIDDIGRCLEGKIDDIGRRLERIEAEIGTLKWVIGAEVAVIGVILVFIKAC